MSSTISDTLLLDPARFNSMTKRWNVPILTLEGVYVKNILINGSELTSNDYRIDGSHIIILIEDMDINSNTEAHVILEFKTRNFLERFWLPIILSVVALVGTLGQPILNKLDILYVNTPPQIEYLAQTWGYDSQKHEYYVHIVVKNLNKTESDAWKLLIGVRQHDQTLDPQKDSYSIVSNYYDLTDLVIVRVKTNEVFTNSLSADNALVQGAIFKLKKGTTIITPF